MDELKPCPFCGGEASADGVCRYTDSHKAWFADGTQVLEAFFVNCIKCGANRRCIVGGDQTRAEAIARWNTRADIAATKTDTIERETDDLA